MPRAVALVFAAQMVAALSAAQPGDTGSSPPLELAPGVVVDGARGRLYATGADGTIARIDLDTGLAEWTSALTGKPLGVFDGRLLAQLETSDGSFELGAFAPDGRLAARADVPLAPGVTASIDGTLRGSFVSRLTAAGAAPVVSWEFTPGPRSGAFRRDADPVRPTARGAAAIDPVSLRARVVDPESLETAELPDAVRAWERAAPLWQRPRAVDSQWIAPARPLDGDGVVLQRWDARTGRASETVLTREPVTVATLSADGRHLLAAEATSPGEWNEYTWSIFSTDTGAQVGEIEHPRSSAPFVVLGRVLILVQAPYLRNQEGEVTAKGPTLRAVDLATGDPRWELDLRDTTYRGPFPP